MQTRTANDNQKRILEINIADSLNLSAIFALFLKETFKRFLEETGRFFMFPIAAAGSCLQAILAWRQASLTKGKNGTVARAVVETVGALAITTAVVGGFVAASVFATLSPIIFTATLAVKSLFHGLASVYYLGKSAATKDPEKKHTYQELAKSNAVGFVAGTLASVAVGLVMIAAKPILAVVGILSGLIGMGYSLYKRCTMKPATLLDKKVESISPEPLLKPEAEEGLTHSARLNRVFQSKSHGSAGTVKTSSSTPAKMKSPKAILDSAAVMSRSAGSTSDSSATITSSAGSVLSGPGFFATTPGATPTPGATSTPGATLTTAGVIPTTPGVIPTTAGVIPTTPGVIPTTARAIPTTTPVAQAQSQGSSEPVSKVTPSFGK